MEVKRSENPYCKDMWPKKELFHFLVWCDLLVYYKQTVVDVTRAIFRHILAPTLS